MKKRSKKKKSNGFAKVMVISWLLCTSIFVANELYPLRILWEQLFPIHYKSYSKFGIKIPTQYKVHGIDVSHHQGSINWKMVEGMRDNGLKIDFAFIKATEGITHTDSRYRINWKGSKENNLIRGAYHYFKHNQKGEEQAAHFIRNVKLTSGDMPPIIDVEELGDISTARLMEGVLNCANKLEQHYGVKPIIYTYHDFYKQNFDESFKDYTLWIAHYYVGKPDNTEWNFWQHNDRGRVSGINTPVDFNVFNRGLEEMKLGLVR